MRLATNVSHVHGGFDNQPYTIEESLHKVIGMLLQLNIVITYFINLDKSKAPINSNFGSEMVLIGATLLLATNRFEIFREFSHLHRV